MTRSDKRIDDYIDKSKDFAKPILRYIRGTVHKACPDGNETIKWGVPHFEYEGRILCSMAAFKEHCAFSFRLASLMEDPGQIMETKGERSGMGHFGKIKSVKDLPAEKILIRYMKEAMSLTAQGARKPKPETPAVKTLVVPEDFIRILKKDKAAYKTFQAFSYSHQKEYVEWITEAKTPETRNRRMATAVEWLQKGKGRNWKYMS